MGGIQNCGHPNVAASHDFGPPSSETANCSPPPKICFSTSLYRSPIFCAHATHLLPHCFLVNSTNHIHSPHKPPFLITSYFTTFPYQSTTATFLLLPHSTPTYHPIPHLPSASTSSPTPMSHACLMVS